MDFITLTVIMVILIAVLDLDLWQAILIAMVINFGAHIWKQEQQSSESVAQKSQVEEKLERPLTPESVSILREK